MDRIVLGEFILQTQVAISEEEKKQGLMHVNWPPPVMIFVYDKPEIRHFWMHNTPSPLDIVFANQGKIISFANGKPYCKDRISSQTPASLVVELPYGALEQMSLKAGDVCFPLFSLKSLARHYTENHLSVKTS